MPEQTEESVRFPGRAGPEHRGQSLVEFAIVLPLLMLVIGGMVQLGALFWVQNTLTQVARDTGRWAATQQLRPCDSAASRAALEAKANEIAANSSLLGYDPATFVVDVEWPIPTDPPGLVVDDCPPPDNSLAWFVEIRVSHRAPVIFPGMQFIDPPCNSSGCLLSSQAEFRMEPSP